MTATQPVEAQWIKDETKPLDVRDDINATLEARGKRYGSFVGHATITQALKDVMRAAPGWDKLRPTQKESLEMNVHKIGRILNGDPDYDDSWVDIAGYSQLIVKELHGEIM